MADITFIPLKDNRFAYLYLLTDSYSRKIVGFHVSDNMRVDGYRIMYTYKNDRRLNAGKIFKSRQQKRDELLQVYNSQPHKKDL